MAKRYSSLFIYITLVALFTIVFCRHIQAQTVVDGEVFLGPTVTSVGSGPTLESYGGIAFGISVNAHILRFGAGSLGISVPPLLALGPTPDDRSVNFQRLSIPIGMILRIGDNGGRAKRYAVAGAITLGYGATFGAFVRDYIDLRPFFNIDIAAGIFEHGSLKLRYSNVFGKYFLDHVNPVAYHGLFIVGSTEW
ncbi:MAG: hypothetical protein HYX66_03040 [Ignavibacteria bacterium]|nr:hypothetical protein [Ignavibacteria bacterium]